MLQIIREQRSMKLVALFLVFVLLSGFFPWQILAQENSEIPKQVIVVKNEMGEPIEGAVFQIQNQQKEIMETCISDADGRAEIFQAEDGIYQLIQVKTQEGYAVIKEQPIEIKTEDPIHEEHVINSPALAAPEIIPETQEEAKTEEPIIAEENKPEPEAAINEPSGPITDTASSDSISAMAVLDSITVKITRDEARPTQFILSTVGYAGKTGITKVLFPVWSERNGQDDLRWYQGTLGSNGEYSVSVDIKDHGFETGIFNVHTYLYGLQGEIVKTYVSSYTQPAKTPVITVGELANNSYKITAAGVSNPVGVTAVYFPTWSDSNGQDDLRWEPGVYIGNDTWEATINLKDYKQIYDTFISHVYSTDKAGKMMLAGTTQKTIVNPLGDITVEITPDPANSSQFIMSTKGLAGKPGVSRVSFPTWSERSGQDDIRWHEGTLGTNGEYSVTVDIKDHGFETGLYNVHTYLIGLQGEVFKTLASAYTQSTPSPTVKVGEVINNSYKVTVTGVSNPVGVAGVSVPTWSDINGQDDLRWEPGVYIGNDTWEATINLKDYKQTYDTFISHVYTLNKAGSMTAVGTTAKTIDNPFNQVTVLITKDLTNPTKFSMTTKGLAGKAGVSGVSFPTWSDNKGQNDLRWYQGTLGSNGEYSVSVDIKDHGFETGTYSVHTYLYGLQGQIVKTFAATYTQPTPSSGISVGALTNNTYKITVTGVSNAQGVSRVTFPTWTKINGQDDLRWEPGVYVGNDTWEATINIKDYRQSYDTFVTHAYLADNDGKMALIKTLEKVVVNPFELKPMQVSAAKDSDPSKFKITTTNCAGQPGIEGVAFPVWTNRNGQDDIRWYQAKLESNGEYSAVVDIENHGFETGSYIINTYGYGKNSQVISTSANAYTKEVPTPTIEYDKAVLNNTFKIRIKNVGNENGVRSMVFPTWSKTNGQDDIRWEQGTYIGNHTWEASINLRNYNIIVDDFVTHAYLADKNGKMVMAQTSVKTILQNTSTVYGYFNYPLDKGYKPNPSDPTDWFGPRWGSIHEGIDIPAPYYANCYSPGDGVIEKAGYFMGYGRYVRIRMTDRYGESVSFFYGHLQEINVSVGQTVTKGQLVGKVGGSGYNAQGKYVDDAYGPHLHFGAIANADFACVDPEIWIDFHNPYSNVR